MGATTGIEWADATWNPVTGCTKVSPGCDHCYAERITRRRGDDFSRVTLHEDRLGLLASWRKPRTVLVCSMADLFHKDVPNDFLHEVLDTMLAVPRHRYMLLTKRPGRMPRVLRGGFLGENVALGVSVESADYEWRIDTLRGIRHLGPRFISAEPLLGGLDVLDLRGLDQVICGGESGPGARPMRVEWARGLRDACEAASVPFFFKQWGEHDETGARVGKKRAGRLLDGVEHNGQPAMWAKE